MKRLLVLSVGLLASASMFGAGANPVVCESTIDFNGIADVLESNDLRSVVSVIPGTEALVAKLKQLAGILRSLGKINVDLCKLKASGLKFGNQVKCLKAKPQTKQGPRSVVCAPYDCGGTKTDCIHNTLGQAKIILRTLFDDFVGSQEGDKVVKGLLLQILELVDQADLANKISSAALPVSEKVLKVFEGAQKIIPADKPVTTRA